MAGQCAGGGQVAPGGQRSPADGGSDRIADLAMQAQASVEVDVEQDGFQAGPTHQHSGYRDAQGRRIRPRLNLGTSCQRSAGATAAGGWSRWKAGPRPGLTAPQKCQLSKLSGCSKTRVQALAVAKTR